MIKIFTDSTSYIPEDLREKYGIQVLSLSVSLDDKEYLEIETDNEVFYAHVNSSENFPQSSQPSLETVYHSFEKEINAGNEVLGIFLSSKMSGTYQTAKMVQSELLEKHPDASITIIDSQSNCMQLGLAVLSAAEKNAEGASLDEVVEAVQRTMKRTRFIFIPKNLKYLEKGGRIGRASALLGNALKIIPILTVTKGETDNLAKVRTFTKAKNRLVEMLKSDAEKLGLEKLVISHINALDIANELLEKVAEFTGVDVVISSIGPVIGTHVGPGAVGFIYQTRDEHPLNV